MSDDVKVVPELADGDVVAVLAWVPGQPPRIALFSNKGPIVDLDVMDAAELGRALIGTAAQALEQHAFGEFLHQDMARMAEGSEFNGEVIAGSAQDLLHEYLIWRATHMTTRFERRKTSKTKTAKTA